MRVCVLSWRYAPLAQLAHQPLQICPPPSAPTLAPGARPILRWTVRLVMAVGVNEPHPLNKKAELCVYLRDLQREAGLTGATGGQSGGSARPAGCSLAAPSPRQLAPPPPPPPPPHTHADAALQHIARVAGPRYHEGRGELRLVCTRYPHREANREHIMGWLYALIDEGHRRHPNLDAPPQWRAEQQHHLEQQQQQAAAVAVAGGGGEQP